MTFPPSSPTSIDPSSLFPPAPECVSRRIEPDQLWPEFKRLWDQIGQRFFKVERLQAYAEPGDPSYEAFLRGDMESAVAHLEERIGGEAELFLDMCRRHFQYVRLRMVELPLTPYLRYEFKSYPIGARYGQRVVVLNLEDGDNRATFSDVGELMVFDDFACMIHDYDAEGLMKGTWIIEGKDGVAPYVELVNRLEERSVPLGVAERNLGLR